MIYLYFVINVRTNGELSLIKIYRWARSEDDGSSRACSWCIYKETYGAVLVRVASFDLQTPAYIVVLLLICRHQVFIWFIKSNLAINYVTSYDYTASLKHRPSISFMYPIYFVSQIYSGEKPISIIYLHVYIHMQ